MPTATAAVLRGRGGPLVMEEVVLDSPRPDEVLVRVASCGICHTDLSAIHGTYNQRFPIVLGHEGAGIVEEVGSAVTRLRPGDHVVLSFDSCAICDRCQSGDPCYCREFTVRNMSGKRPDGSSAISRNGESILGHYFGQSTFATRAIARERNAIKVSAEFPIELLGPLGCGIQTGAGTVLNTFKARYGQSIVIFGTGSVGLSAVMAAKLAGLSTIVGVDLVASRLEIATQLGATHVFDGRDPDLAKNIAATTGHGVDFAFETTGVCLEAALGAVDELGVVGLVGSTPSGRIDIPYQLLRRGRSIRTIIEGDSTPSAFIPTMIQLWQQGRFPFDAMYRSYDFADINQAAADSLGGGTIKPVLRFG